MAEARDHAEALRLFTRAWDARTDDFDAAVAAHYVARHQPTPEETLRWNALAVHHAERVPDDRARGFLPSLLLCLGKSLEDLGRLEDARAAYLRADASLPSLEPGPFGDLIRSGVASALLRIPHQLRG